MEENIGVVGLMIKCMDMDNLFGHKVKVTRVHMRMILNMDLVK